MVPYFIFKDKYVVAYAVNLTAKCAAKFNDFGAKVLTPYIVSDFGAVLPDNNFDGLRIRYVANNRLDELSFVTDRFIKYHGLTRLK